MSRKLLLFALSLLFSFSLLARTRAVSPVSHPSEAARHEGGSVSGVVDSVSGTLIHLAGGLVTVDAAGAKVLLGRGVEGSIGEIEPGMLLMAIVRPGELTDGAAIPVALVVATRPADVSLTGRVERVDLANQTLTLFGRTVQVTPATSFGGFRSSRFEDVVVNQLVHVDADAVGGLLVARSVLIVAPSLPPVQATRGIVRSIAADLWVVDVRGEPVSLVIDANTRIVGSPRVGDTVEVLYRVDASNAKVALAIARIELTVPAFPTLEPVTGTVRSIGTSSWVVRTPEGSDVTLTITPMTRIEPGIVTGDAINALVERRRDGTLAAFIITRRL